MTLRVATTQVESFRLVDTTTWASEADLVEQILGKFVPRWQMSAGIGFHSVLEHPGRHRVDGWDRYRANGYVFRGPDVHECLKAFDRRGVFECKEVLPVTVAGKPVEVVAKVDQILGSFIQENKAKFSPFDYDFYDRSFQWRFYLWVFGARKVTYNVHLFTEPEKVDGGELVELKGIERFSFYPYPGLEDECRSWLARFLEWAESRSLTGYLRPRTP